MPPVAIDHITLAQVGVIAHTATTTRGTLGLPIPPERQIKPREVTVASRESSFTEALMDANKYHMPHAGGAKKMVMKMKASKPAKRPKAKAIKMVGKY